MNAIQTTHKLDFESREWKPNDPVARSFALLNPNNIQEFRVGTCYGQWFYNSRIGAGLCILSVINDSPGNGHLDDVFQWFEYSAKTYKQPLMILELMNERFKKHCIEKRGFHILPGTDHLVKIFC